VVLERLETPLGQLLSAAATGDLGSVDPLRWADEAAVVVVLAAAGYPASPQVGDVITGAEADWVLHAGTARDADGQLVTAGGRVLSVLGTGPTLAEARNGAYGRVGDVHFDGAHYRSDIAKAAAESEDR
jgi:phosphoribosylamine--glycine ligase